MGTGTGNKGKRALAYALLFLAVSMVISSYSNTLTSPPYLDDFHSFIYPKAIYLQSLSASGILSLARSQFGWARFLPVVTYALNHYLGHSSVIYFHAVNILIHLLAFLAVFWLLKLVLTAEKQARPGEAPYEMGGLFPLCVAAIWALSPLQTSAVTYLVQRMASMQALFFTLCAACFIKARLLSGKNNGVAFVFYFLCALAAICAFLSKENSALLPVVLTMVDIWFFDSAWLKKGWAVCRKTGWKVRAAAAGVLLASSWYGFAVVLPKVLSGYAHRDFDLAERLLTEGRVVVWYMSLLLWPSPARLSMEHDTQISTSLFSPLTTFPALLLTAALIIFAVRYRRRLPAVTFGIAWFFLNLVIESTIVPLELAFEHRLYLPSVGLYLSVAAVFAIFLRKAASRLTSGEFAKAACSLLLICASCFALLTFIRNEAWENKLTIHYDAVMKAPESPRTNADLANTLAEAEQYEEAIKYAEKAIKLGKNGREAYGLAENALIVSLKKLGRTDEAIENGEKFLEEYGDKEIGADALPDLCINMAMACLEKKKPDDALRWVLDGLRYTQLTDNSPYNKGLIGAAMLEIFSRFDPHDADPGLEGACGEPPLPPPVIWAAEEFKRHGEAQYAREIVEREYAKNPDDSHLKAEVENLQKEDAQNQAQKEKWNSFQKYVMYPFSRFNFDMAVAYLVQEKQLPKFFQEIGERRLDAALEISPGSSEARLLKGWYFFNREDADHAVEAARKVLDGDPENSNAWLALGFFLAKAGDNHGAVAAFKKVIDLYPGYSRRSVVEQICDQLRQGKTIESASAKEGDRCSAESSGKCRASRD
ncbi:MAG TPA: tetratricopeptide repeat protein [Syntrophobacteraceae bacterium]|nr:tetratricopeptide repeat protein [Syntrophobacteraceae bacterium]